MARPPPPAPPPPPPPPPPATPQNPQNPPKPPWALREALERAGAALGPDGGLRELLSRRRDSFLGPLKWLLFHRLAPPLIQEGPQCGLVALVMGGSLFLPPPAPKTPEGLRGVLGGVLGVARARGFTNHGEMFSAQSMASLAQELFPVQAELLSGGLGGPNRDRILRHLLGGLPALVPYDEDSNHAPCLRGGHKAHWALLTGVLLGVPAPDLGPEFLPDPEIPNLFHGPPAGGGGGSLPFLGGGLGPGGPVLVLAQQGKSPRPQMWPLGGLRESNAQLGGLSPRREGGGFVLPPGGVSEGLRGRVVLLHPRDPPPAQ